MANEFDLFEILEISPGPPEPDEAALRVQLDNKKRDWSRSLNQGTQKAKREAQRNLELLPAFAEILADPGRRRAAAAQARSRLESAARAARQELDQTIALLKKGSLYCDRVQLEALVRRFEKIGRQEIERSLRAAGVSLERKARKNTAAVEPIDTQLAQTLQVQLEHLGKATLYDFLGLPVQSSAKALRDQAKEIYHENQRLGRNDSRSSAANRLAGLCSDRIFVDDEAKKRYDAYLATVAMESLKGDLDFAGLDRTLSRAEVDHFLESARRRGVAADDALAFIERYAEERGWMVQTAAEHPAETLQQCGFCSALAPAGAARCPTCGKKLTLDCPRCGKANPTTAVVCFECGCSVGDATVVQALLAEGREALVELRFGDALQRFDRGLLYWPDWPPLVAAKKEALAGQRSRQDQLAELDSLVATGQLSAATQHLQRLEREGIRGLGEAAAQVRAGIDKAQQLFERGLRLRGQGDRAGADSLFEQALAFCSDLPPLLKVIAEDPPEMPAALRVEPRHQGFHLTWKGPNPGLQFRVLRKAGGLPRDDRDGQRLGDVGVAELDDDAAPMGMPLYYAVFSLHRGVPSRSGATSGPHVRVGEVEDPAVVARDGEVRLSWRKPAGCLRVEVFRRQGAQPPADLDGEKLAVVGDFCQERGLPRGVPVSYRVVAVFPGPTGRDEQRTGGWTCSALPAAPDIEAVRNLKCQKSGNALGLSWDWPAGITSARICFGHDGYPESPDQPGSRVDLSLAEYRKQNGFVLPRPEQRRHFFAVFAHGADGSFSPAARVFIGLGQESTVSYRLELKRSLVRRSIVGAALALRSESADLRLPPLLVVAKPKVVPIAPRDGRIVLQTPELRFEQGLVRIEIPQAEWQSGIYLKVFFLDPAAGEGVRLLPAAKEELYLG